MHCHFPLLPVNLNALVVYMQSSFCATTAGCGDVSYVQNYGRSDKRSVRMAALGVHS
jgi:hypothetical protein